MIRGEKTYISAVEDSDAILVVTARATTTATSGCRCCSSSTRTRRGSTRQHIPTALNAPDKQWTLFFDDVEVRRTGSSAPSPAG